MTDKEEPAASLMYSSNSVGAGAVERRKAEARETVLGLPPHGFSVLVKIAEGWSAKEIADDLGVSLRAYDLLRADVFARINAKSTADAVRVAIYAGLV